MDYLGPVISAATVSPDPPKLRVVADWLTSKTGREMQCFSDSSISTVNTSRRDKADSTTVLPYCRALSLRINQADSGELKSFTEIKRRLCAAPRIAHPELKQPIVIYTDASNISVSAVLLQRNNSGVERAISFFSKKLSLAPRNFHVPAKMSCNYMCTRAF